MYTIRIMLIDIKLDRFESSWHRHFEVGRFIHGPPPVFVDEIDLSLCRLEKKNRFEISALSQQLYTNVSD